MGWVLFFEVSDVKSQNRWPVFATEIETFANFCKLGGFVPSAPVPLDLWLDFVFPQRAPAAWRQARRYDLQP